MQQILRHLCHRLQRNLPVRAVSQEPRAMVLVCQVNAAVSTAQRLAFGAIHRKLLDSAPDSAEDSTPDAVLASTLLLSWKWILSRAEVEWFAGTRIRGAGTTSFSMPCRRTIIRLMAATLAKRSTATKIAGIIACTSEVAKGQYCI